MIVSSFVIVTDLATPKVAWIDYGVSEFLSSEIPAYSLMYCPPVKTAISCMVAFLLSPKDGALTTQIFKLLFNLLMIKLVSNSLSTSSAMIRSGLFYLYANSKYGRISWILESFFSTAKMKQLSNWIFCFLSSVTKYGETKPLSNLIPSTNSISWWRVLPSWIVMVPWMPTLS